MALSLVLMHGFGLSHTETAEGAVTATAAAHMVPASHAWDGGPTASTGPDAAQPGQPQHVGTVAQACLAVLTAVIVVLASALLVRRTPPWGGPRRLTVRAPRRVVRPVWVRSRFHLVCVMRT
ncbi:MAG: hypothetical protein WA962_15245 [Ornithinimicrobium sp.]